MTTAIGEEWEAAAIQTVLSDGKLYEHLEQIRSKSRVRVSRQQTSLLELQEELRKLGKEVEEELSERLQVERESNTRKHKEKDQRIEQLEKENALLKERPRKRHRKKYKR